MAKRAEKSALLLCATRLANLDLIDENVDGGKAYKAVMLQAELLCLQGIITKLQGGAK